MTIWSILRQLEIFYGHLVYFVVIWYISPRFGILYQEKSGNPALKASLHETRTHKLGKGCKGNAELADFSWYNIQAIIWKKCNDMYICEEIEEKCNKSSVDTCRVYTGMF
jgi:hypothetical protein